MTLEPVVAEPRPVYDLLPVIHRLRDAEQQLPLSALLSVVEDELLTLRTDVDGLYDDWFIETCAEWVVSYIGDLLGVQGLRAVPGTAVSGRALVANTIRYRRGKGTPGVLERVARDVTGWPARVVEYFQLLGATQHLDHVRLTRSRTADLRDASGLALVGTPFDETARTIDVRHIDSGRGRYNVPHIGLHLWRLAAYRVEGADARAVPAAGPGRWTFDPVGRDVALFHAAQPAQAGTAQLTQEPQVPAPLRRRALLDDLAAEHPVYLAEPDPAFRVVLDGQRVPVQNLVGADLGDWHRPPAGTTADPVVAVDPVRGRLTVSDGGKAAPHVQVDYAYGLAGDVGAGPFDRRATLTAAVETTGPASGPVDWLVRVSQAADAVPGRTVRSLGEALLLWNSRPELRTGQTGVIAVMDSATYAEDLAVTVPQGDRLLLVAASVPVDADLLPAGLDDVLLTARGLRPHLAGDLRVTGAAEGGGQFLLDGLSVEGTVAVLPGDLATLVLSDVTVVTDVAGTHADGGWVTASANPHLAVHLLRVACAGVRLGNAPTLSLTDSILYAAHATVAAAAATVQIDSCTVMGEIAARILSAGNSLLVGQVEVGHRQEGCVRFSYLPLSSHTPRRYRCLPADEATAAAVVPRFTSVDPTAPGFGQLALDGPVPITTGADDEGELGVYHFLQQSRRMANLSSQLDQYLRFGLEAGIFFAT